MPAPGSVTKAYGIQNKTTGEWWVAHSGKRAWARPKDAKSAWSGSWGGWAKAQGLPVRLTSYKQWEIIRFNEQEEWEIVELDSRGAEAIRLLEQAYSVIAEVAPGHRLLLDEIE